MGDATRHLAPGCLLLRLQQIREVFKHDHVSQFLRAVMQSGNRDRDIQGRSRGLHFHLAGY